MSHSRHVHVILKNEEQLMSHSHHVHGALKNEGQLMSCSCHVHIVFKNEGQLMSHSYHVHGALMSPVLWHCQEQGTANANATPHAIELLLCIFAFRCL